MLRKKSSWMFSARWAWSVRKGNVSTSESKGKSACDRGPGPEPGLFASMSMLACFQSSMRFLNVVGV
jgi:hypothetical protein